MRQWKEIQILLRTERLIHSDVADARFLRTLDAAHELVVAEFPQYVEPQPLRFLSRWTKAA